MMNDELPTHHVRHSESFLNAVTSRHTSVRAFRACFAFTMRSAFTERVVVLLFFQTFSTSPSQLTHCYGAKSLHQPHPL